MIEDENCHICSCSYQSIMRMPFLICDQQHFCCCLCYQKILKTQGRNCPQCRQPIQEGKKFNFMEKCEEQITKRKTKLSKTVNQQREQLIKAIGELLEYQDSDENVDLQQYLREKIVWLMINKQYETAILFLKKLIEENVDFAEDEFFLGLGSIQEEKGFCQNKGYEWYSQHYGQQQISLYDKLAFCFLRCPNYEEQKLWYYNMLQICPKSYRLLFGLALTQHNIEHQKTALKLYEQVTKINPSFFKSYLMIAFLERSGNHIKNSQNMAEQCLKRDLKNFHAQYIITSVKYRQYSKVFEQQMLKNYHSEPNYVRPLYEIALYLSQKNTQKAIEILNACMVINQHYIEAQLLLGQIMMKTEGFETGIDVILKVLALQHITEMQKSIAFELLARFIIDKKHFNLAQAKNICTLAIKANPQSISAVYFLVRVYYLSKGFQKAIQLCKFILTWRIQALFSEIILSQEKIRQWKDILYKTIFSSYYHLKKYTNALDILKEFPFQISKDSKLNYFLGVAYKQIGQHNISLKYLSKCLRREIVPRLALDKIVQILNAQQKYKESKRIVNIYMSKSTEEKELNSLKKLKQSILSKMNSPLIINIQ